MNELKIFEHPEFGEIRTAEISGEPWLVGKDVAAALGYSDTAQAIRCHVDEDDKGVVEMTTPGGKQKIQVINESGLYSLILSSKLPGAKKFKRWVTSDVLPAIRRNGGYIHGAENMTPEELMAKALMIAQKTIEAQAARLEADRPKVLFADSVSASRNSILVGEMAKLLKQNGVETGQNRFFETLRDKGFLIRRKGTDYNMPTQKSMEMGLFEIKETVINHADGHTSVSKTPKVTGKGQQYFVNMFLGGSE